MAKLPHANYRLQSDPRLEQWRETTGKVAEWMEEAETMAVAGCRRVLEDGPEMCSSESAAEYSERGEEYSGSDIYTPDMMNLLFID
jgi:hypothetical protein